MNFLAQTDNPSISSSLGNTPHTSLSLSLSLSLCVYLYPTLCNTLHACLLFNHVSGYTPTSSITILHRSRYGTYLANKSYCVLNTYHTNILSVSLSVCLSLSLSVTRTLLYSLSSLTLALSFFVTYSLSLSFSLCHLMFSISHSLSLTKPSSCAHITVK